MDAVLFWIVLAVAAGLCLVIWRLRRDNLSLVKRAAALEDELHRISQEREYRVERLDVLWFPVVSFSSKDRVILGVRSGVPYCKTCVEPLSASGPGGAWVCAHCRNNFPPSLADLSIADMVGREGARYFLERNKDYKQLPARQARA